MWKMFKPLTVESASLYSPIPKPNLPSVCIKCGWDRFFGPRYDSFGNTLLYICDRCSYYAFVPCLDERAE